eukprot:TRINITY_DN2223_c0_g1_i4.p1 TRINITY_DN2223_c0_g1~~TRINITY_DN2223_c0_g1_i4.p1  ORF type:complete len:455 (+),score=110.76 TRINITY_DN2223_c0_g1_i4:113-1477(+)
MNLLIVICLSLCWTITGAENVAGIIQRVSKKIVADDIIYILKTIFENARFWEFKDIREKKLEFITSKGLSILDIDVTEVTFNTDASNFNLTLNSNTFKTTLDTIKQILSYKMKFKWQAVSSGVHLAFGEASASFDATKIEAVYNPTNSESSLETTWTYKLLSITGTGRLTSGITAWINSQLNTVLRGELVHAINNNKKFLHEYMHYHMRKLRRRLNDKFILDYDSQIFKVVEEKDHYVYSHKVWVHLTDKDPVPVTLGINLPPVGEEHGVSIYVASQFIPLTINSHGLAKKCDEDFDLKTLGLTGTVKDLFGVLPELFATHNSSEPLNLRCEYAHKGIDYKDPSKIQLPAACSFSVNGTVVLDTEVTFDMSYAPAAESNFMKTKMNNVKVVRCASQPGSMTTFMFLANLFSRLGLKKFGTNTLQMPMIRYTPRKYTEKVKAEVKDGIFAVHYDY